MFNVPVELGHLERYSYIGVVLKALQAKCPTELGHLARYALIEYANIEILL